MTKSGIGTLNEKSLHAALKVWYGESGDVFERPIDGFVIDIVRGDLLLEIQTGGFSPLKRKLRTLVHQHQVRLIYPIARQKWIVKLPQQDGGKASRRKSPKRGRVEHLFRELVYLPTLLHEPNFSLEVLLIDEEEVRGYDGKKGWRRKGWVTVERRLLAVETQYLFQSTADVATLLPTALPQPFTTAVLAQSLKCPRWLAQKMSYCLREMGEIEVVGKEGRAILYVRKGYKT